MANAVLPHQLVGDAQRLIPTDGMWGVGHELFDTRLAHAPRG
jgi:hypothetical protein